MQVNSSHGRHSASIVLGAWEQACESLSNALSIYRSSCRSMEEHCQAHNESIRDIAFRIDSSLDNLHTKFSEELCWTRAMLARTRNGVLSRFNSLPKELVAQIFLDVVYSPGPTDGPNPSMVDSLKNIVTQQCNILSVCSTWRDIGLSLGKLCSIVPIVHGNFARSMHRTAFLSLQRYLASQQQHHLYLAAILPPRYTRYHRLILPSLDGHCPPFSIINIKTPSISVLVAFLNELVEYQVPRTLSELSIYRTNDYIKRFSNPPRDYLTDSLPESKAQRFFNLIGSLAILRIRGVDIRWEQIAFSNRLVKFDLGNVVLGGYSKLLDLLQTLQSAPELRDLKLGTVFAFPEATELAYSTILFPKLRSLWVENLDFGVLELIFHSLGPGTHRTTLNINELSFYIHRAGVEPENVDPQRLADVLARSQANTLLLDGNCRELWMDGPTLSLILDSVPTLTSLLLVNCVLRQDHLSALQRPNSLDQTSRVPPSPFPNLTELCLINVSIRDADALKQVVNSHPLERVTLASKISVIDNEREDITDEWDPSYYLAYKDDDSIVQWLKNAVPQFSLVGENWGPEHGLRGGVWPLW